MIELAKRKLREIIELSARHVEEFPHQQPDGVDLFYRARMAGAGVGRLMHAASLAEDALRLLDGVEEE